MRVALVPASTALPFAVDAGCCQCTGALGQVCVLTNKGGDTVASGLVADIGAVHVTDYLAAIHSLRVYSPATQPPRRSISPNSEA